MDIKKFAQDLLLEMKHLADNDRAPKMKAYMKNHFEFLGVESVKRRIAIKNVYHNHNKITLEEIYPLMEILWSLPYREMQYLGMDLSKRFCKHFNETHLPQIKKLIATKSWWDTVDFLASNNLGGALYNTSDKGISYATSLIHSDNLWLRRSALLYQLKYKEETNFELLEKFILITINEQDFFIRKAHGWSLRQYSKFNRNAVGKFIESNKNQLSKLAIKEGSKYL